ncbi:MAG: hypothetical protein R3B47_00795 [Bacteroidia bacterium]
MKPGIYFLLLLLLGACNPGQKKASFDLYSQPKTPEVFAPGLVSSSMDERDFALSPKRDEIVFTRGSYDQSLRVLVSVKKHESGWSEPALLSFSGKYQDIEPFFSVGGDSLFFASKRPIFNDTTRTDYNIWFVKRAANGWSEPQALEQHHQYQRG